MTLSRLDAATADFGLDGLFLEATPQRLERLAASARSMAWEPLVRALESHGVLLLFLRNLALAGVEPPADARALVAQRERVLREDARRFRFTLLRFLHEAQARGVVPVLLKGASLGLDLYPDVLRSQGDIDLLVKTEELAPAISAARAIGLIIDADAFPGWWYRLAHFHRKLVPATALVREIELHWSLVHPSALLTIQDEALRSRAQEQRVFGVAIRSLDPADRFLHLVTHLVSHAGGALGPPDRTTMRAVLEDPESPLKLRWTVDIHAEWEKRSGLWTSNQLAERAHEWNAEPHLCWALRWVRSAWGFEPDPEHRAALVLEDLGAPQPLPRRSRVSGAPVRGFDFRARALGGAFPWAFPPASYLERRYGARSLIDRALWRALRGVEVLARLGLAVLLLPAALVGRVLLRRARKRAFAQANSPERVLDLSVAWRRFVADEPSHGAAAESRRSALGEPHS